MSDAATFLGAWGRRKPEELADDEDEHSDDDEPGREHNSSGQLVLVAEVDLEIVSGTSRSDFSAGSPHGGQKSGGSECPCPIW